MENSWAALLPQLWKQGAPPQNTLGSLSCSPWARAGLKGGRTSGGSWKTRGGLGLLCPLSCISVALMRRGVALLASSKARHGSRWSGPLRGMHTNSRRGKRWAEGNGMRWVGIERSPESLAARRDWSADRLFQCKWAATEFAKIFVCLKAT